MSMVEDTRYRSDTSHDPYRQDRADAAHEPSNDPLTELARLIGQSDPFGDVKGRRAQLDLAQDQPAPGWLARPGDAPADDQAGYADNSYAERSYGTYRQQDAQQHDPSYDQYPAQGAYAHDDHYARSAHIDARHGEQAYEHGDDRYHVAPPAPEYESDDYYDDGHLPPRGDDDGLLHGRRRGGIVTIAAVLGLALIGTAGAVGYRAFTGPSADATPPVIKADPTPPKTTPAAPTADAQDKPFQERVGAPGTVQTERIVPREEAPVAQPVPPASNIPPWPTAPAPRAAAPAATAPVPGDATRRVRTETIRMTPPAEVTATTKAATTPPARAAKQNAPMAIAPPPADVPAAPPTRTASRTAPAADGAYVVQVSAQKTESEAQSSYRALQAKYPAVLGSREPTIRRADLGDKGVYYRAQIGGFASAGEATTFCENLKAAGGQCIVQKN